MEADDPAQPVRALFAAFGRGDIPVAVQHLAEDVEWQVPGTDAVPYAGAWHGRDEVAEFFQRLGAAVEFEQFAVTEMLVSGDHVVVTGQELGRVRATGALFENEWAMVFTVRSGRIVGLRLYEDTEAVARAFRGA
jgi:ketosteroid isomerase-like protein